MIVIHPNNFHIILQEKTKHRNIGGTIFPNYAITVFWYVPGCVKSVVIGSSIDLMTSLWSILSFDTYKVIGETKCITDKIPINFWEHIYADIYQKCKSFWKHLSVTQIGKLDKYQTSRHTHLNGKTHDTHIQKFPSQRK
jgi:hypothetical protein